MTDISEIIRRTRRRLSDVSSTLYEDAAIVEAIHDFASDEGAVTIGRTPTRSGDNFEEDLSGREMRALACGAALSLLRAELVEASRDAISMDGPSGRLNTTHAPAELRAYIRELSDELSEAAWTLAFPLPVWVDTSAFEDARTTTAT